MSYIAILFLSTINKLENMTDVHVSRVFLFFFYLGITHLSPTVCLLSLTHHRAVLTIRAVNIVFFVRACNVQNAGEIMAKRHPHITVGHAVAHVPVLLFDNVLRNIPTFNDLLKILPSMSHKTTAMSNRYLKEHNRSINQS